MKIFTQNNFLTIPKFGEHEKHFFKRNDRHIGYELHHTADFFQKNLHTSKER